MRFQKSLESRTSNATPAKQSASFTTLSRPHPRSVHQSENTSIERDYLSKEMNYRRCSMGEKMTDFGRDSVKV